MKIKKTIAALGGLLIVGAALAITVDTTTGRASPSTKEGSGSRTNQPAWWLALPVASGSIAGTTNSSALTAGGSKAVMSASSTTYPLTVVSTGLAVIGANDSTNGSQLSGNNLLMFRPFCTGDDGDTGGVNIWGWRYSPETQLWIPSLISTLSLTAGTSTFTYGGSTYRWFDTISETTDMGPGGLGVIVLQPTTPDNTPAMIQFDYSGYQLIEFEMTRGGTGGSNVTAINGFWMAN